MKHVAFTLMMMASGPLLASAVQDTLPAGGLAFRHIWTNYQYPFQSTLDRGDFRLGAEVEYFVALSPILNIAIPFKLGTADYPFDKDGSTQDGLYLGLDALLQLRMNAPPSFFHPFLFSGIGANYENLKQLDWSVPLGMGLDIRLGEGFFLAPKIEYRLSREAFRENLQVGIGLKWTYSKKSVSPTLEPAVPVLSDRDRDGVPDIQDRCPDELGSPSLGGCPDRDSDGIMDKEDECPDAAGALRGCPDADSDGIPDKDDNCPYEAGLLIYKGCPLKDTDKDGLIDDQDECPDVAGPPEAKGCPDKDQDGVPDKDDLCPEVVGAAATRGCPDTDRDGVMDSQDRCPNTPGLPVNNGCPEIQAADLEELAKAARAVQFETGSATLKQSSYSILDKIVEIMRRYPDFQLLIGGHTDNVGDDNKNLKLSTDRALACYDYLVFRGIGPSRMSYQGFGESRPIADNLTPEGREHNRRVEFTIKVKE